ncbi:hypothetical protein G7Y89_g8736 [Cudoniella acicularis]|uniref:Uncharacterized protein n=1 Tax=Cudoniella acicularis TaxID=354080 RepID=A0A8H4RGY9_9HELO|nr:hypothetical protein G7Y89_g8736 [Cudoniella acicularis]
MEDGLEAELDINDVDVRIEDEVAEFVPDKELESVGEEDDMDELGAELKVDELNVWVDDKVIELRFEVDELEVGKVVGLELRMVDNEVIEPGFEADELNIRVDDKVIELGFEVDVLDVGKVVRVEFRMEDNDVELPVREPSTNESGILFPAHAQIQWDNVYNTCGPPSNTNTGGAAILAEVVAMAKSAGNFMDSVDSKSASPWDYYRVITAFDAFFDAQQTDAQTRWNTVRANLKTMENVATPPMPIWVSCDDTTVFGYDTVGMVSRQYFKDPATQAKTYIDPPIRLCAEGVVVNGETKYLSAYRSPLQDYNLLVICPKETSENILLSQLSYKEGDALYSQTTLSTTFFHEMAHVMIRDMKADTSGGIAADGERYGWGGTQEVRSTYSVQNPDSLTFYAMALSMEEYLWNSGSAVSLQSQYTLLQQNDPRPIQNLNLPQPTS